VAILVSAVLAVTQVVASAVTGSVGIRAATLDRLIDLSVHGAALVGVWAATRPPDKGHPYGFERYETLTSLAIGVFLLVTVAIVVRSSVLRLDEPVEVKEPFLGIATMVPASLASFWLTWFLNRQSLRLKSDVLLSESSHFWADGLSNATVVVGIIGSVAGVERLDPLVGLAVSSLIGFRAIRIVIGAADRLTDAAFVAVDELTQVASRVPGVLDCHAVRSRGGAGGARVDLHIHVDPEMSVRNAHRIAEQVDAAIKDRFPDVAEVLVHIGADGGRYEDE
jgi:cation diffusion facilitator family transporter